MMPTIWYVACIVQRRSYTAYYVTDTAERAEIEAILTLEDTPYTRLHMSCMYLNMEELRAKATSTEVRDRRREKEE